MPRRGPSTSITRSLMEPWDGPAAVTHSPMAGCIGADPRSQRSSSRRATSSDPRRPVVVMALIGNRSASTLKPRRGQDERPAAARQDATGRHGAGTHRFGSSETQGTASLHANLTEQWLAKDNQITLEQTAGASRACIGSDPATHASGVSAPSVTPMRMCE